MRSTFVAAFFALAVFSASPIDPRAPVTSIETAVGQYSGASVVYQSGVAPYGASPFAAQNDPDLWLLRDCMFDAQSRPVNMFWQAASTEGNELAVQVTNVLTDPRYYQTHLVQRFPRALNAAVSPFPD